MFISSATGALAPYRSAAVDVCHRLGFEPVNMEEFPPERPPPVDVCRRAVEACDILVLLLAHRYGSRPEGDERSYTEVEYDVACASGLALLAFVVDPDQPWPPRDIDRDGADALDRFVARVGKAHTIRRFGAVERFREDLILALRPYERAPVEDGPASDAGLHPLPSPPELHAVPRYVGGAPFTGRRDDLATLDAWAASDAPVMVVEAIGGTGKSALTWEWACRRAPTVIDGYAGALWWSFYEGSASMTRFLRELLAYTSRRPLDEVSALDRGELAAATLGALRARPFLVVLDGFERLLSAYHRFDPSKLRDDDVETSQRSLMEPQADEVVRALTSAGPSKLLISTRLLPDALETPAGRLAEGVARLQLPGLRDEDVVALLRRLDVRGDPREIATFFGRLGNHPLLIGVVAGLVRDYRPEPGNLHRWLADPTAGGVLKLPDLDLKQRRTHILAAGLAGLDPGHRRVLGWISVLGGAIDWPTIDAINPFRGDPPQPVRPAAQALLPQPAEFDHLLVSLDEDRPPTREGELERWFARRRDAEEEAARATEAARVAWRASESVVRADAQLDVALLDLEQRGLLWWDRSSNTYDLHPIVRAHVHDELEERDRISANERVRDHFQALPPEDVATAQSVEDVRRTIAIYRALVGAGQHAAASGLYEARLDDVLMVRLGAYATVVELVGELNTDLARWCLSEAYHKLGRIEDGRAIDEALLRDALGVARGRFADPDSVVSLIRNVGITFQDAGSLRMAGPCFVLADRVEAAAGGDKNAEGLFRHAYLERTRGRVAESLALLEIADTQPLPDSFPWYVGEVRLLRLRLACDAGDTVTEADVDAAEAGIEPWSNRVEFAAFRRELLTDANERERALDAALLVERLERGAGIEVLPAARASLLARLGRREEALAAVEDVIARLERVHPADRPHGHLADALAALGRADDAADHALQAYRQGWADGPPYAFHWDLRDARERLERLGVATPELPTVDPDSVRIPHEDEIRAYIAALEASSAGEKRGS